MPAEKVRQHVIAKARRVVVKVGTSALTDESGRLDRTAIRSLCRQIGQLQETGVCFTLVASGAIGAGMGELNFTDRPTHLPMLQATAAVGQGQLMRTFHDTLARRGVRVAQVLVTRDDFENRTRYLNIRNTLTALHELRVLPILNENDAVATDEIRFGDNDIIAAHVTNMLAADLLVLLSTVDGVMDRDRCVDVIEKVDASALSLADGGRSRFGSGGMASKMEAAGLVTRAGEAAIIANARTPNVLKKLLTGKPLGTLFLPGGGKLSSRRRWIGQAARPAGKLRIDEGAVRALTRRGKSLLPSGIVEVQGQFEKGATVLIVDADGREIARGLSNYSSRQLEKIRGLRSGQIEKTLGDHPYDEAVHRNNMTLR